MEIADANVIIRYLLGNQEPLFTRAKDILENKSIFVPNEVFAEVIYVLEKLYNIPRRRIFQTLTIFLNQKNILVLKRNVLIKALEIFCEENIDLVDSILIAHNHLEKNTIHTFDKKLLKLLKRN